MEQTRSAYNTYWRAAQHAGPFTQTAQTYDYNHQTATVGQPACDAPPPPPGVDAQKPQETPLSTHLPTPPQAAIPTYGVGWSYPPQAYAGAYPYAYSYPMTAANPVFQYGQSLYNAYVRAPMDSPVSASAQVATNWNAAQYSYPTLAAQRLISPNPPRFTSNVSQLNCGGSVLTNEATPTPYTLNATSASGTTTNSLQEPPATLQAKCSKEQWSDELKDYVQRAFCSIDTVEEKDQMERILKEKLEYIFRNNIQVDWVNENIPTVPSKALAAMRRMPLTPRGSSINVVRPTPLVSPHATRVTGPARGSLLRLPVGLLTRGARGAHAPSFVKANGSYNKRPLSRSRSPSGSPPSSYQRISRRARKRSRSRSRSSVSSKSCYSRHSSSSSVDSRARSRRRQSRIASRSRSRSRSGNRGRQTRAVELSNGRMEVAGRGNRKKRGRNKQRGGRDSNENTFSSPPDQSIKDNSVATVGRGRGSNRRKRGGLANCLPSASESRLSSRANRFKEHLGGSGSIARTTSQLMLNFLDERDELSTDFEACQIVGTMQELEKPYLRLTRAPEPFEVRPPSILKQSLEHVKEKWLGKKDYHWICEQFKSIRQDLTVQGIEDELAVAVYETHADAALDAGDFEEFHQCQSQLLRLHTLNSGSSRLLEFTAYRLLYYIFTLDQLGINAIMAGLRPSHKSNPCIMFALNLRSAWSLNNYCRFFRLACPTEEAPQPPLRCGQVVSWFLDRERRETVKIIFKVCVYCEWFICR